MLLLLNLPVIKFLTCFVDTATPILTVAAATKSIFSTTCSHSAGSLTDVATENRGDLARRSACLNHRVQLLKYVLIFNHGAGKVGRHDLLGQQVLVHVVMHRHVRESMQDHKQTRVRAHLVEHENLSLDVPTEAHWYHLS